MRCHTPCLCAKPRMVIQDDAEGRGTGSPRSRYRRLGTHGAHAHRKDSVQVTVQTRSRVAHAPGQRRGDIDPPSTRLFHDLSKHRMSVPILRIGRTQQQQDRLGHTPDQCGAQRALAVLLLHSNLLSEYPMEDSSGTTGPQRRPWNPGSNLHSVHFPSTPRRSTGRCGTSTPHSDFRGGGLETSVLAGHEVRPALGSIRSAAREAGCACSAGSFRVPIPHAKDSID